MGQRGRQRIYAQQQTMHEVASWLALSQERVLGVLDGPRVSVVDATGLSAKYDFELTFAKAGSPDAETWPDIFSVLQSQLGLKLEPRKVSVDILVVDHMEKIPSGN